MIQTFEKQHLGLLSIDYGKINDKNELQNLIIEHKSVINHLIKQIHELNNLKDKEQLDRDIIINKMQEDMIQNAHQIITFKNKINKVAQQQQKTTKQFQQQKQKTKKNSQYQHSLQMAQLYKKFEQIQIQYRGLKPLEEKQQKYIKQISDKRQSLINKQYQHHDNMNKQQKKQLKQNSQITNINQSKLQQAKKNIHTLAKHMVIEERMNNQEKNAILKQKLSKLQIQLSQIKKNRNLILQKKKQLNINVSLNLQQLEEYKAVGSLQKAKIKAYKDKIQQLRLQIAQQIAKKQRNIQDMKKQKLSQIKILKNTLLKYEKQKQIMKINIQKMKLLSQTILAQRQQVQQFFIMALENCKKQIEKQNINSFALGKDGQKKNYGEKVDIEQLTPKDKQRILTNLYTKLALGP